MKKHALITAIGMVLGLVALSWVQPLTSSGAALLLLIVVVLLNAIGTFIPASIKRNENIKINNKGESPRRHNRR